MGVTVTLQVQPLEFQSGGEEPTTVESLALHQTNLFAADKTIIRTRHSLSARSSMLGSRG